MPTLLPGKPVHMSTDSSKREFEITLSRLKELTIAATAADSYFMTRTSLGGTERFAIVHKPRHVTH